MHPATTAFYGWILETELRTAPRSCIPALLLFFTLSQGLTKSLPQAELQPVTLLSSLLERWGTGLHYCTWKEAGNRGVMVSGASMAPPCCCKGPAAEGPLGEAGDPNVPFWGRLLWEALGV